MNLADSNYYDGAHKIERADRDGRWHSSGATADANVVARETAYTCTATAPQRVDLADSNYYGGVHTQGMVILL